MNDRPKTPIRYGDGQLKAHFRAYIPDQLDREVRAYAAYHRITYGDFAEAAFRAYLDTHKQEAAVAC